MPSAFFFKSAHFNAGSKLSILIPPAESSAAKAIADLVSDEELNEDFIMPEPFDPRVSDVVSQAVKSHIEA